MWVFLEDGRVFVCGGDGKREAWMIGVGGTVERQPAMNGARYSHGLIAFVKAVYVFGGWNGSKTLKTCEKLPLGTPQWRTLPNMNEVRVGFNPCLFGHLIYLCGYSYGTTMEAFAPQTDTFLPVPLTMLQSNSNCYLYVYNDLLVVLLYSYIVKFAVEGGQLVKRSEVKFPGIGKDQNSQSVVAGGVVYMVWGGECVRFSMETGAKLA